MAAQVAAFLADKIHRAVPRIVEDSSTLLLRFNRLMRDLRAGTPSRNSYHPWEVELLIDLDSCRLPESDRARLLDRYQRAARRQEGIGG